MNLPSHFGVSRIIAIRSRLLVFCFSFGLLLGIAPEEPVALEDLAEAHLTGRWSKSIENLNSDTLALLISCNQNPYYSLPLVG